jgi:light-independent protochlorophyllide reductase subunit B
MGLPCPIIALDLPSYSHKENWGAAETFYQIVRQLADKDRKAPPREGRRLKANLLGPTALGFRHRDDVIEVTKLLADLGIDIHVAAPMGSTPADIAGLGEADFNVVLYPEVALPTAQWLEKAYGQPYTRTVPIGVAATRAFVAEVAKLAGLDLDRAQRDGASRLPWWSNSVDSTYLTGKRVFIFGDATHVLAAARAARAEFGFKVAGIGTYSREFAREVRDVAAALDADCLISDDYLEVEAKVAAIGPELVLGTQMERHIAKRLGIPCAVISAPVHVQDFPARYSPQMGFEGANVLFDSWVHPLMMGLEEHLLTMFRDDPEFHDAAPPSHLGHKPEAPAAPRMAESLPAVGTSGPATWTSEAERELKKIPFFVRGRARGNTESFARERGLATITVSTLYEAKAHFGR